MPPRAHLAAIFLAALLSSGLFLVAARLGLGFLFLFLPTLPLLSLGLSKPHMPTLAAALLASFIVSGAAGPAIGLFFLLFLALPAWYIPRAALLWRQHNADRDWFPIGLIFLRVTLYGCAFIALATLFYATQRENMPALLARTIREGFSELGPEYGDVIDALAHQWSFLVFSITLWLWGMALYAHAWIANRALAAKSLQLRPDFAIRPFPMPAWMLTLLAICALASLIGGDSMRFLGKSTLVSLMLPYFFAGTALMHESSKNWPSRGILLFFIYFVIAAQFWPALGLSGLGLWHQIKRLSSPETSSKN